MKGQRDKPLISVITVVLNDHDGLRLTIDSVASQDYSRVEHVVMDGGSTDGSLSLLEENATRSGFVYCSGPDSGIFDAMNKGAERSSGDVLVFLNAADAFTTKSELTFVADEWAAADWEWGYGALRYVQSNGAIRGGSLQAPFQPRKLTLGFKFVPHQAMFVSRELHESLGGYDTAFPLDSDQEFAMRALARSTPVVWVRFMCDFLVGGAHENVSRVGRELSYHRMRKKNSLLLGNSRTLDVCFSVFVGLYRSLRDSAGRRVRVR